ncbi:hypothetical protein T492DRAFT_834893 [Pavlovales sp. CCMP2436]|nr:hypothetical protein T492DRAFT_834893 [Pavlovales sp. CCMP2436]
MLEEALRYFDGTLLIASHDRFFTTRTVVALGGSTAGVAGGESTGGEGSEGAEQGETEGGGTGEGEGTGAGGLRVFTGGWAEYAASADLAWRGAGLAAAAERRDADEGFVNARTHAGKMVSIDGKWYDERGRELLTKPGRLKREIVAAPGLKRMKRAKRAQVGQRVVPEPAKPAAKPAAKKDGSKSGAKSGPR